MQGGSYFFAERVLVPESFLPLFKLFFAISHPPGHPPFFLACAHPLCVSILSTESAAMQAAVSRGIGSGPESEVALPKRPAWRSIHWQSARGLRI